MCFSSEASRPAPIALLLPGMTLNATIFPDLGLPTIAVDFNELVLDGGWHEVVEQRVGFYAGMLQDFLDGVAGWRDGRRVVVGHSFGGMLALTWLLSRPRPRPRPSPSEGSRRVHGLVLIATTAGPMFERLRLRVGHFLGHEWRLGVGPLLPLWNTPLITRTVKRILTGGRLEAERVDFTTLTRRTDIALDLAGWRNTGWQAMRSYRLAMQGFDVRDRLGEIDVPTIVLHGTDDALFSVKEAEELARRLPTATLRIVEGAAHGLPLTHGDYVREAVRELLE